MTDPLKIFPMIKEEVLKKFPDSVLYAYGSRTGSGWKIKKEHNFDFDVIIFNQNFSMDPTVEHKEMLESGKALKVYISEKYTDEFGRPVKVDFFFTNAPSSIGVLF
jgi:hypothetical protein